MSAMKVRRPATLGVGINADLLIRRFARERRLNESMKYLRLGNGLEDGWSEKDSTAQSFLQCVRQAFLATTNPDEASLMSLDKCS